MYLQNGVEALALLTGVVMGLVFGLQWRGSLKGVELKDDPRVKSLLYGLVTLGIGAIADWNSLLGDEVVTSKARLMALYGIPYLLTGIAFILVAAVGIQLWSGSRRDPKSPRPATPPGLQYLHYGFRFVEENLREADTSIRRANTLRSVSADSATALAGSIVAINAYRREPTSEHRDLIAQQLLRQICDVVSLHSQTSVTNASLMVAQDLDTTHPDDLKRLKFHFGDIGRYRQQLAITDYAYPGGVELFSLPVESGDRGDWAKMVLPGAPEAFLRQKDMVVEVSNIAFAADVPEEICADIRKYFRQKDFESFACLIVPGRGGPLGIVSVESKQEHIFRRSPETQNDIAKLTQPFCSLIGTLV